MAKKYLSLERLAEYDALIKAEITEGDESALSSANAYTDSKISSMDVYSKSEVDTALSNKSDKSHNHDDDYDAKGSADTALASAKSYADTAAANAASAIKNDLLNGAGEAYDTLKELGDLINDNTDAIDALEKVATGKADADHTHDDRYYTESEVDSLLESKADSEHNHNDVYYTKTEIENLELITISDIDAICNANIRMAREVTF